MCGGEAAARGHNRAQVSNEFRTTINDHVIYHGLSFRKAGQSAPTQNGMVPIYCQAFSE